MYRKIIEKVKKLVRDWLEYYQCITSYKPVVLLIKEKEKEKMAMTKLEKEEFVGRIKAFDEEEMALVVENIPVHLCLERIAKELDKAKAIESHIKNVAAVLGE